MSDYNIAIENMILDPEIRKKAFPRANMENGSFFLHIPSSNRGNESIMGVDAYYKDSKLIRIAPVFKNGIATSDEMSELTSFIRNIVSKDNSIQTCSSRSFNDEKVDVSRLFKDDGDWTFEHTASFPKVADGKELGLYQKEMPILMVREDNTKPFMPYTMKEIEQKYERDNIVFELMPSKNLNSIGSIKNYRVNFESSTPLKIEAGSHTSIFGTFRYDLNDDSFKNGKSPKSAIENLTVVFPEQNLKTGMIPKTSKLFIKPEKPNDDLLDIKKSQAYYPDNTINAFPSIVSKHPVEIFVSNVGEKTLDALSKKMDDYKNTPVKLIVHPSIKSNLDDYAEKYPDRASKLPEVIFADGENDIVGRLKWSNPTKNQKNENIKTVERSEPSFN